MYIEQEDINDPQTFILKGFWGSIKRKRKKKTIQKVSLNYKNQIRNFKNFYSILLPQNCLYFQQQEQKKAK